MEIVEKLNHAREIIVSGRARMQQLVGSITQNTNVSINSDVKWDGGKGLQDFDTKGAGTPALTTGSERISELLSQQTPGQYERAPEMQQHIEAIAEARGIPVGVAEKDFDRSLVIANGIIDDDGNHFEIVTTTNGYGSQSQLRFGHVVGEALEIDPAFASILSPDGGLTGPGAHGINIDGDGLGEEIGEFIGRHNPLLPLPDFSNEALKYHSPTHDGYGFLNKHLDIGPGYCYAPGECTFGPDNPLSGQVAGITYWDDQLGLGPDDAIRDATQEIAREGKETIAEINREGIEGNREIAAEQAEGRREVGERVENNDFVGAARESVEAQVEVTRERVEKTAEQGRELVEGGIETGREFAEGVVDTANETTDAVQDKAEEVVKKVWGVFS